MAQTRIVTLDLNFQGRPHAIASFLIRHGDAVVLIESGPGSTLSSLEAGLAKEGLSPRDITHVLLTHIHLDHAGAAGWLSRQGAQIFVHPIGAPHLLNPEKLIASATRIYGDRMGTLWGEFLPVDQNQLTVPKDAEEIAIGELWMDIPNRKATVKGAAITLTPKEFDLLATFARFLNVTLDREKLLDLVCVPRSTACAPLMCISSGCAANWTDPG